MDQKNRENEVTEKGKGPIDFLKEEHQATFLKLDLMERALQYLLRPPAETTPERVEVEKMLLKDLAVALEREIRPHFRKEEEALFPTLAEYIGREHGPIEAMLHEHVKIISAFPPWKKAVTCFCCGADPIDDGIKRKVLDPGIEMVQLIRVHMSKENQILFKISESSLSKEEKEKVLNRMRAITLDL